MVSGPHKDKKWLGYTLYVVLVTTALLYYLFPAQSAEEFLNSRVRRINQDLLFKAGNIKPWIPSGMRISGCNIFLGNMNVPIFYADTFYVGPQILKFVKGEYVFDLQGMAYGGDLAGTIHFTDKNAGTVAGDLIFNDVLLQKYAFLTEKFEHRLIGRLSGEIVYDSDTAGKKGGGGRLELKLSDGQLQFKEPLFDIVSVDLQNIRMEAQLSRGELTITKAELNGSDVNGTMTGSILLHKDINLSQINLKGTLEPQAAFYQKYPDVRDLLKTVKKRVRRGQYSFAVTGTLGDPEFRLL
jgi:type II secretion system protein N